MRWWREAVRASDSAPQPFSPEPSFKPSNSSPLNKLSIDVPSVLLGPLSDWGLLPGHMGLLLPFSDWLKGLALLLLPECESHNHFAPSVELADPCEVMVFISEIL